MRLLVGPPCPLFLTHTHKYFTVILAVLGWIGQRPVSARGYMLWQLICCFSSHPRIRVHWASINLFQSDESRIIVIAWKNSWHFVMPLVVSSQNDVWEMSARIPTNQKHYADLGNDMSSAWNFYPPISKMSFREETTGCVTKCRLDSLARMIISQFYCKKNRTAPLPWTSNSWDWQTCLLVCYILCFVFSFQYWRGVCTKRRGCS